MRMADLRVMTLTLVLIRPSHIVHTAIIIPRGTSRAIYMADGNINGSSNNNSSNLETAVVLY